MPAHSPQRIHIVGVSPRTGTTLLAECMVACMNIDAFEAHEASVSRLRLGPRVYLTKRPADLFAIDRARRTILPWISAVAVRAARAAGVKIV